MSLVFKGRNRRARARPVGQALHLAQSISDRPDATRSERRLASAQRKPGFDNRSPRRAEAASVERTKGRRELNCRRIRGRRRQSHARSRRFAAAAARHQARSIRGLNRYTADKRRCSSSRSSPANSRDQASSHNTIRRSNCRQAAMPNRLNRRRSNWLHTCHRAAWKGHPPGPANWCRRTAWHRRDVRRPRPASRHLRSSSSGPCSRRRRGSRKSGTCTERPRCGLCALRWAAARRRPRPKTPPSRPRSVRRDMPEAIVSLAGEGTWWESRWKSKPGSRDSPFSRMMVVFGLPVVNRLVVILSASLFIR